MTSFQTHLLYLNQGDQFKGQGTIVFISKDERGPYVLLDQTLFYPQGGGQPSDQGNIITETNLLKVNHVRQVEGEIRHYYEGEGEGESLMSGQQVSLEVDADKRLYHARYHSAGHLIAHIVEALYPSFKAIKGHHFPGEAFVEFQGIITSDDKIQLEQKIHRCIQKALPAFAHDLEPEEAAEIFQNLPYNIPRDKKCRTLKIGHFPEVPCGGTHVKNLSELGQITLTKIKSKGSHSKIFYLL